MQDFVVFEQLLFSAGVRRAPVPRVAVEGPRESGEGFVARQRSALLVFPPVFEPELPYLAPAALSAALRRAGRETAVVDLNLLAHEALLGLPFQTHCRDRVRAALRLLEAEPQLAPADFARYETLVRVDAAGLLAAEAMPAALDQLRSGAAFAPATFDAAMRTVLRGFALVSAAYPPTQLTLGGFDWPGLAWNAAGVLAAAADAATNPFVDLYETSGLLDDLAEKAAGRLAVGVSVVDSEQLVPALTLCAGLRRRLPETHLVLGGPYLTKLVPELEATPEWFDVVDAVVAGEGETALLALLDAYEGAGQLARVPNLLYRAGGPGTPVRVNRPFSVENVRSLAAPDFGGLPLERYWSPEPVLPLLASRGCYWGRCTFCAHSYIYRRRFSADTPARVAEHMAALHARHGVRAFFFADEGLSAPFVRRLSAALRDTLPEARWGMEARFEPGFDEETLRAAHAAGLRLVVFGLESANARVLARMRKGIVRDHVERIVDTCVELGIAVHLWLIAGFPTETQAEALETLEFVFGHEGWLRSPDFSVGLNRFTLTRHCPVERHPDDYGVRLMPARPGEALQTFRRFESTQGMSEAELDEVFVRFDWLERSLPPDVRRTGRVYHLLRRAAGVAAGEAPADDAAGTTRLAVRRCRFDLGDVRARRAAGDATPVPALGRPEPSVAADLAADRLLILRGALRERLDRALGDAHHGVFRLSGK